MVPKKKPIDSDFESVNIPQEEALEQTATDLYSQTEIDEEEIVFDENTTVFSEKGGMICKKKTVSDMFSRIRTLIIVSVLAVSLLLGVLWAAFILREETSEGLAANSSIPVLQVNTNAISEIVVDGEHGELVLTSKMVDSKNGGSKVAEWTLEGYEKELIASSSVNAAADSLATMYANRILEENQSKKDSYGFADPLITAKVTLREGGGYTVLVGSIAPDKSGYYVTVTGDEKIYLVSAGVIDSFNKTPEAFANTVIIETPNAEDMEKKTDKKYFDESGVLTTFDSIEISGTKYGQTATLKPVPNNDFAQYVIELKDHTRFADSDVTEEIFGLLTNGLVAIDTYKLLPSKEDIKAYGLDNPEIIIKIKYGSGYTEIKASLYSEQKDENTQEETEDIHYAVMIDGQNAIYSVLSDAVPMFDYNIEKFYNQFVFLEYMQEFTNLSVEEGENKYSFDISYKSSDNTFVVKSNGKAVDDALLSVYYQYLLTLAPEAMDSYVEAEPSYTATLTYKDTDKGKKVIELIKQTDRRYLVRIDGLNYGIVNSTDYDHLVLYVKNVIKGDNIPEPA